MRAVYRPLPPLASLAVALAAAIAAGCGAPAERAKAAYATPRIEAYELAQLAASRSYEAVAVAPGGAILARDSTGRSLLFPAGGAQPRVLLNDPGFASLALYPDGVRVLGVEVPGSAAPPRLFRIEASGVRTPIALALLAPRFLGWRAGGAAFYVAGSLPDSAAGSEGLYEVASDALTVERAGDFPAGFRIEAVAADGSRLALRRALHPEADEIYLVERPDGEIRLVLPADADARFRPVAFSPDARRLLLLTDEGSERLELEWLDLASGARRRLPPPDCEPIAATLAREAPGEGADRRAIVVVKTVCSGARSVARLDATSGARLPIPSLPVGTRALDLVVSADGVAAWVVGDARLPRDLLRQVAPEAPLEPLTWGLAAGIDPERVATPATTVQRGGEPAMELWPGAAGRSAAAQPRSGLIWVEDDGAPPAWRELEPLFQFLAGRGVAVARIRLRGSDGFGRAFRHAADGQPLAAALADLESARRALVGQGVDPRRIALAGDGAWPGAVVAALAAGRAGDAPAFATHAAFGADPDPLARLDTLAGLSEPAKSWWTARLGAADDPRALEARAALRSDVRANPVAPAAGGAPAALAPLFESAARPAPEEVWRQLAPWIAPR